MLVFQTNICRKHLTACGSPCIHVSDPGEHSQASRVVRGTPLIRFIVIVEDPSSNVAQPPRNLAHHYTGKTISTKSAMLQNSTLAISQNEVLGTFGRILSVMFPSGRVMRPTAGGPGMELKRTVEKKRLVE